MISKRFQNNSKSIFNLNSVQLAAKNEIENKLNNGHYSFETICCPICNSKNENVLSQKDRYGLAYSVKICLECGLVYTNPRMNQQSYNEFYDLEYRRLYLGAITPSNSYFEKQYERGALIYSFIKDTKTDSGELTNLNVLEVGCSSGGILKYFKDKGCEVLGIDLDSTYLNYGRDTHSLNLIHGSLEKVSDYFKPDIIIYSHVLEHILDIEKELKRIEEFCLPETLLYIEVPGIKNIHQAYNLDLLHYFQNAHTFHFSLTSLTNLLGKNNFKLLKGDEFIRSIFIHSATKNAPVHNDFGNVLNYLKKIEKRRYLNQFKIRVVKSNIKAFWIRNIITILKSLGLKRK